MAPGDDFFSVSGDEGHQPERQGTSPLGLKLCSWGARAEWVLTISVAVAEMVSDGFSHFFFIQTHM